jgi:D-psicose/D-tagatose/L-ribulose 3-epimerase
VIGVCEWIFGSRALDESLACVAAAGAEGIEVTGEPARDAGAVAAALSAAGLVATGTTAASRWPTDERDLAHSSVEARRRAVEYYRGCVELAAAVGAPVVGLIPGAVGRIAPLTTQAREWGHAVEGVREVALYAAERGVSVAVEAINRYETHLVNRVEQALELADATGVDGVVGVIADMFHMQLEEEDPAAAVARAGPVLRRARARDAGGRADHRRRARRRLHRAARARVHRTGTGSVRGGEGGAGDGTARRRRGRKRSIPEEARRWRRLSSRRSAPTSTTAGPT